MAKPTVFLFGEAEKGAFGIPFTCSSLLHFCDRFGILAEQSQGISYAVQTLLYDKDVLFCRVESEGFSIQDYMKGFLFLKEKKAPQPLQAIFLPGVGDREILEAAESLCTFYRSILVLTERDLYDYLLSS